MVALKLPLPVPHVDRPHGYNLTSKASTPPLCVQSLHKVTLESETRDMAESSLQTAAETNPIQQQGAEGFLAPDEPGEEDEVSSGCPYA